MINTNLVQLMLESIEEVENSNLLVKYFVNLFAGELVLLNPKRLVLSIAGRAATSEMGDFNNKLATSFMNMAIVKEYFETSKSDVQWRDRIWKAVR